MKRAGTGAVCAALCITLILSLGCPGSATLSDFLGADLTDLLSGALGGAGGSANANQANANAGLAANTNDHSEGNRNANDDSAGDGNANGDDNGNANGDDNGNDNGGENGNANESQNGNVNAGDNSNANDNGDGSNGNDPSGEDLRIAADLTGSSAASGQAEFRREAGRRRFSIEVEDFPAGIYDVFLNDVKVTQIEVGDGGFFEIEFDSSVEPGHVGFPADFPESVEVGDTLRLGDIVSGVF